MRRTILWLIILASVFINIVWVFVDISPPHWDAAIHLDNSLHYADYLRSFDLYKLVFSWQYYPPFIYIFTSVIYSIFGQVADIAVLSTGVFWIILLVSVYQLSEHVLGRGSGLTAALVIIGMPFVVSQSREYQLDFPLTSIAAVSLLVFIKSAYFSNRGYTILLGLSCAAGLLTKWSFLPFILGYSYLALAARITRGAQIQYFWLFVAFILFFCAPWYAGNSMNLISDFIRIRDIGIAEGDPSIFTLNSLLYYPTILYLAHLRFPLMVFMVFGLYKTIQNRKQHPVLIAFCLIGLFYLYYFTLFQNKDPRFIEPLMPILSLIITYGARSISHKYLKKIIFTGLLFIVVLNYTTSTFYLKFLPMRLEHYFGNFPLLVYEQNGYTSGPPVRKDWKIEKLFFEIRAINNPVHNIIVFMTEDKKYFNTFVFRYYCHLYRCPFTFRFDIVPANVDCGDMRKAATTDVILTNGLPSEISSCFFPERSIMFKLALPDESVVTVYGSPSVTL